MKFGLDVQNARGKNDETRGKILQITICNLLFPRMKKQLDIMLKYR